MSLPITSRLKRTPLTKQSDNAIDPEGGGATKTSLIKGKKGTEGQKAKAGKVIKASKQRCGIEVPWSDPRCVAYGKMSKEDIQASEVKQGLREEGTPEIKGTKGTADQKLVTNYREMKKEGTMLEPWEINRQRRSMKSASRGKANNKSKMRKYGSFTTDESGKETFKANKNLSRGQQRRLEKAQDRYDSNTNLVTNLKTGTEGGRKAGESYSQGDQLMKKGKLSKKEQEANTLANAGLTLADVANTSTKDTTTQDNAENVANEEVKTKVAKSKGITTSKEGEGLDNKKDDSGLKMRKAPLKMGYSQKAKSPTTKKLQGNQNRLPQQLQDAIKSAPTTMRGPLKKGYFKNK